MLCSVSMGDLPGLADHPLPLTYSCQEKPGVEFCSGIEKQSWVRQLQQCISYTKPMGICAGLFSQLSDNSYTSPESSLTSQVCSYCCYLKFSGKL